MTSLLQHIKNYGEEYLWGLEAEQQVESKVKKRLAYGKRTPDIGRQTKKVDPVMLRRIVLHEPLIRKAIFKKNKDTFKNGFVIKDKDGDVAPDHIIDKIEKFNKKTNFLKKLFIAGCSSNIYGTGFIEKIYDEHGNTKPSSEVKEDSNILGVELLNSEFIRKRSRNKDNERDKTKYLLYNEVAGRAGEEVLIHPSRVSIVKIDELPFSFFGLSVVEVAWNILKSKMSSDVASGDILNWFGKGMYDLMIHDMDDEQEKKAKQTLKDKPDVLIHDQDFELDVKTPTRIDPQSFYDYFYTNIAAALEMPKHMLTGAEIGNVTGSEVGVSAYYSDIENIQKLIFEPIIEDIYRDVLKNYGLEWKYTISWNPIFVDELSEAKILQTRAYAAKELKNSGIIDNKEARKMMNIGIVNLDPNADIEEPEKDIPDGSDPNIEPQPVKKPESKDYSYQPFLTKKQREMIEELHERGKREELEQEKRIREAQKKREKDENI